MTKEEKKREKFKSRVLKLFNQKHRRTELCPNCGDWEKSESGREVKEFHLQSLLNFCETYTL